MGGLLSHHEGWEGYVEQLIVRHDATHGVWQCPTEVRRLLLYQCVVVAAAAAAAV